jgi:hypothetical protein
MLNSIQFNSMRWAAKPEKGFKDTETIAQKKGEKKWNTGNPIVDDGFKKKEDQMSRIRHLSQYFIILSENVQKMISRY